MRTSLLVLLAFLFSLSGAGAQDGPSPVVEGTIVGHDGEALTTSHVHVRPYGTEPVRSLSVGDARSFSAALDTTGVVELQFTGHNHEAHTATVLVNPGDTVGVDVRLGTFPEPDTFDVKVFGEFNDFSLQQGTIPMERRDDGTYAATVPSPGDSLTYGILGARSDGTEFDRLTYANHGDYRLVLATPSDSAQVTFDPSAIPRSDQGPTVTFRDTNSVAAQYAAYVEALSSRREDFISALREADSRADRKALSDTFDWSPNRKRLEAALKNDRPADVKNAYRAAYLEKTFETDSTLTREALSVIPASSPLWGLGGGNIVAGAISNAGGTDAHRDFAYKILRETPLDAVKAGVLLKLLIASDKEDAEAKQTLLYSWLESEYPDSRYLRIASSRYAPDRSIQKGKQAPEFEVAGLRDSTKSVRSSSFEGQYVLLDFWATWCGPCIEELPTLRKAYEEYGDDNFAILSLSFDQDRATVTDFLEDEEMPWMHAFVEEGFQSDLADKYEVVGIPKPILLGPDGTIVETSADLRGEELLDTLKEHLEGGTPTSSAN